VLRFVTTLVVFLICSLNTALANQVSGEAIVRDADTIVVSGTPVRLNGIDAPEIPHALG
jgi:micrococcal nuclease